MHDVALDYGFETSEEQHSPRRKRTDPSDLWKWVAGVLLSLIMFLAGFVVDHSNVVSRMEVREMLSSGDNPYVLDKGAMQLRLEQIERRQTQQGEDIQSIKESVNRIGVALGVDPAGNTVRRRVH